jgi:hypothetical protein
VASEVHYIAIHFLFEFKVFVSPVKPLLECLHNSGVQWAGGAWHGMRRGHGQSAWRERRAGRRFRATMGWDGSDSMTTRVLAQARKRKQPTSKID